MAQKRKAEHKRESILISCKGRDGLKALIFWNRNIFAFISILCNRSIALELEVFWCPGQCGILEDFLVGVWLAHCCLPVLLSSLLQAQVDNPWWQRDGHRPGNVAWKNLFLLFWGHSNSPFSLEIYCTKFPVLSEGSEQREICRRSVWGRGSYLVYISEK